MSLIAQVRAQDVPGSNIVSRTFLSPDGSGKIVQRVYDNGLGDVVNRGDGVFDSITNWLDDILYRQQTK